MMDPPSSPGVCGGVFHLDLPPFSTSHLASPVPPAASPAAASRLSAFEIVCLVGKGGFGRVLLVRHKAEPGSLYAMKVMHKSVLASRNAVRDAQAERDILAMLVSSSGTDPAASCPFIVKLHVAFQTEQRVYLVMDFAAGGEIMFHLRQQAMLSEDDARFYAAELLVALEFLHARRIIHRDLKPENVLISHDGHLLLTDFGLAKDLSDCDDPDAEQKHSWCGSEDYMAPEIIGRELHTGKPADWWAFGIFLFDCLVGHPPFSPLHEASSKTPEKKSRKRLHDRILKCKYKLPTYLTSSCHSIIRALLTRDPAKRLTDPAAIRAHPWFASINWDAARSKQLVPPIMPPAHGNPTACFSPSLTTCDHHSAPNSPLVLNFAAPDPTPSMQVPGSSSSIPFDLLGAPAIAAPVARNPPADGVGIWEGFSFVAPGMEAHFRSATPPSAFASASASPLPPFMLQYAPVAAQMPLESSPVPTPCASPTAFSAPPTMDQLAAEVAEFSLEAAEATRLVEHP
jgi:serine/threonine protein kinase